MNLYFVDKYDNQHLVAKDVGETDVMARMPIDLYNRYPNFKNYYNRTWWDEFHRLWIDYGSHTEFYILQEEKYALNVVDDAAVQDKKGMLNVVNDAVNDAEPQDVEKVSCSRGNRDYCDI